MRISILPLAIRLLATLLLPVATSSALAGETRTYTLDPTHAHVLYAVDHLGFSTSRGAFRDVSGTLQLDLDKPENAKLDVTIPVAGFDSFNKARDEYLMRPEFFDPAKYPEIKFVSTKVQRTGAKTADVTGNLTLRGVTRPVTLKVTLHKAEEHGFLKKQWAGFSATGMIKRSEFGMGAGVPMVSDAVQITLDAEFGVQ